MRGVNAAAARGLRPLESEFKARFEFCADHGFHAVEDVRQIINLVGGAAPVGRFSGELNEDFGFVHDAGLLRIGGLPFRATSRPIARGGWAG